MQRDSLSDIEKWIHEDTASAVAKQYRILFRVDDLINEGTAEEISSFVHECSYAMIAISDRKEDSVLGFAEAITEAVLRLDRISEIIDPICAFFEHQMVYVLDEYIYNVARFSDVGLDRQMELWKRVAVAAKTDRIASEIVQRLYSLKQRGRKFVPADLVDTTVSEIVRARGMS